MKNHGRLIDLAAFVAVLVCGIVMILIGVEPDSMAVVVVALVGLYGSWNGIVRTHEKAADKEQDDVERDDAGR